MELNKRSIEYKPYCRLLEEYEIGIVKDDDIILFCRDYEENILNWFYNHRDMQHYDATLGSDTNEEQEWIRQYLIADEHDILIDSLALDVLLEMEYRLLGSPNIKELREELGLSITELAIRLRIPARILERFEKGLELPPNYFRRFIYLRLLNAVEYKRSKDRMDKLEAENPGSDFIQPLMKDVELNTESSEYPKYIRLMEQYTSGMLKDDDIILFLRNGDGAIADWFFNHEYMQKLDFNDSDIPFEEQTWRLSYLIWHESDLLIEAEVLDVILELEYQLMGSPSIKELREKLDLTLDELGIKLRMPKITLYRIENGVEVPPNYFLHQIYVKLIEEIKQKQYEEENPGYDLDQLLNDTPNGNQNNEALETVDDSIDNLGKNNFEDEDEIYITPSKSAINNFYKKVLADFEEKEDKEEKED